MDKKSVLNIISEFKKILVEKGIRIDKLILFGSYANLTYKEGSDIDLVIVSDSFKDKGYWERIDIISDAIYEIFQPIEATGFTNEEWEDKRTFIAQYARNGELV